MGTAFGDGAKMSDIISKIPSSMLVNDTADAAQVNKALLNQVQGSNKIIDAVNTVNAAVTAVGSGIVELGTNSNGTYVKWGNGLMVQFSNSTVTMANSASAPNIFGTTSGTSYFLGSGTLSFPATWVTGGPKFIRGNSTTGTDFSVVGVALTSTTFQLGIWRGGSSSQQAQWFAIGFYK